ncbi:amidohydrolase [Aliihoeflea sp. 40Bstr573]|uniref:amidohydrolase n=1 Tax=Aliihoeflea sp. 40Bstr573 TaxID=2696467 RepID=UPI002094AB55|nr:amidohydrolase [Aliihoeflea sp. 40Bstr573]MCO6388778.1 amidohydrolase [Aliihoeflea sp. 40Bstr573]
MSRSRLHGTSAGKASAFDFLDRNATALGELSDALFYFAEPSLEEHQSSALLAELLEEEGFVVERGISGFPTGFMAVRGEGGPVIALHAEYDACPQNSQRPGVLHREEMVEGAPGHCEGHNGNGAVMVAAAIAVKRAMDEGHVQGTLKVFGAPAEELTLSRPYFVRDGYFDDVDAAFHNHIGAEFSTEYGLAQISALSADFEFAGTSAHAGISPWEGCDALDAVVLMDAGIAQYREHMKPQMRAHRVITNGGEQPNVIPNRASAWWCFRDPTASGVREVFERAKRIGQGAAMMTDTELTIRLRSAVWPVRCNETLARLLQSNMDIVGMPAWTEEEQAFAKSLQETIGKPSIGLNAEINPLRGPRFEPLAASNDCGDISWKVPMGRVWWPGTVPGTVFHHWSGGVPLTTSITHRGALAGAKVLAGAVIDCMGDPAVVEDAQRTFRKEIADTQYEPLVPASHRPDIATHRGLTAKYGPLQEPFYRTTKPVFS